MNTTLLLPLPCRCTEALIPNASGHHSIAYVSEDLDGTWCETCHDNDDNDRECAHVVLALDAILNLTDLGVSTGQAFSDVKGDISEHLDEAILREASAQIPDSIDVEAIIEELRQERIFATWSEDERDLPCLP